MSAAAALAFTLLFVADDPAQPAVVVDVAEDDAGRRVDVVVVCGAAPAGACANDLSSSLVEKGSGEGSRRLRQWPVLPRGASVVPAVDGVVVTVDDVGPWQAPPGPPSTPPASSSSSASSSSKKAPPLPPVPALPVVGERGLRVFVPVVVDGEAGPAVLYGDHTVARGTAVVFLTRPQVPGTRALALSVANVDGVLTADAGPALVLSDDVGGCARVPTAVQQLLSTSTSTRATCAGTFAASRLTGTRPAPPSKKASSKKASSTAPTAAPTLPTWGLLVRPRG
jgi:hypothetical protein